MTWKLDTYVCGTGLGFQDIGERIVDERGGHVATTYHFARRVRRGEVTLNGRKMTAMEYLTRFGPLIRPWYYEDEPFPHSERARAIVGKIRAEPTETPTGGEK